MIDDPRLPARFWRKVVPVPHAGCWLWTGCDSNGYGRFGIRDTVMRPAHRVAYAALVGSIPDGLHLDHLCCTPACVNPQHLEPVTVKENLRRASERRWPRRRIRAALLCYGWNKSRTARELGISRSFLIDLVKRYQLVPQ